ncbi:Eukaryotic/viral aspartic protease, partial [Phytophthora megakarya]
MVGPDKNWHRQLCRTTKTKLADLLESFQTRYCGLDITTMLGKDLRRPHNYLYQLNVTALRAKLKIKGGNPKARREHVDHYIETLGDPELADRLTLLRLADVDELEEVLRARERAKNRQRRSAVGSKYRQKAPASAPAAPVRAMVRAGSGPSHSGSSIIPIFLAAAEEKLIGTGGALQNPDPARSRTKAPEVGRILDLHSSGDRDYQDRECCSHCGSKKHTDLDCWKRLTCAKCGKRGHPTDRCLYACRGCGDVHEAGKCPMEEFYNPIRKWYDPTRHAGLFPEQVEKIYCIYAFVNKAATDRGRKVSDLRGNTCNLHSYTAKIASLPQISEFSRSNTEVALDLKRGESRGYWKRHSTGKWFRQAKISGRINQEKAILLLDTGAEVSILDTTFARKVGCNFDTNQRQECVGIGDNVYTTEGRTKIKITLAGYQVCFFDIWIEDLSGQNAILGMDFMVPAGVRMYLADGSMRLPNEVGIPLNGRKRLYGEKVRSVILERSLRIPVEKLLVTRGERWVPTVTEGPGRIRYLVISNVGEKILRLVHRLDVGMILDQDKVPRSPGFVSVGSRWYREWQNLALVSTVDTRSEPPELIEDMAETAVQRPSYPTPRPILRRAESADMDRGQTLISTLESRPRAGIANAPQIEATFPTPERIHLSTPATSPDADRYLSGDAGGGRISDSTLDQATDRMDTKDIKPKTEIRAGTKDIDPKTGNPSCQTRIKLESGDGFDVKSRINPTEGVEPRDPPAEGPAATTSQDAEDEVEIYYHASGDLSAEDLEGNLA